MAVHSADTGNMASIRISSRLIYCITREYTEADASENLYSISLIVNLAVLFNHPYEQQGSKCKQLNFMQYNLIREGFADQYY